ncbi:MAG: 3-phosphoshikimate 1-carboxyvinyltransferase [Flavobacteriales bacterium]
MQNLPDLISLRYLGPQSNIAEIKLPLSKSIANRLLIISRVSKGAIHVAEWSDADDTIVLQNALSCNSGEVNIGHAGTAMRFLTAYYASTPGTKVLLTGSERMKQRPVKMLVDALFQLDANIRYAENEGYPPLIIEGKEIKGGEIEIQSDVSSQFISALMLLAPSFSYGLHIVTKGKRVSQPYIDLTVELMKQCGAKIELDDHAIKISPGSYQSDRTLKIEADWSAAAFWFGISVLSMQKFHLQGLQKNSFQGDSWLIKWFSEQGLRYYYDEHGLIIDPSAFQVKAETIHLDLVNYPDLAQMFCVLFAALKLKFRISGLQTLPLKETNRIEAIMNELSPFKVRFTSYQSDAIEADATLADFSLSHTVITYKDHRMAMAFSLLAFTGFNITIKDPGVVTKSYPGYWIDLSNAGVQINKQ